VSRLGTDFRAVEAFIWNEHERETAPIGVDYVLIAETRESSSGRVVHRAAFPLTSDDLADVADFIDVVALPHVQGEVEKLTPGTVPLVAW
jgi:hypothetical protein